MTAERVTWCWRCHTTRHALAEVCPACGDSLHAEPPPTGEDVLEIDISGMAQAERDEFLLFMDGADIEHQIYGYLLVISAKDEERTRGLLAAVTKDELVELDPEDVDENSEWARTVAAMLHPSGRCDVVVAVGPGRRVAGALVSYTVWTMLVVTIFAIATVVADSPTLAVVIAISMVPILCETWLAATRGSSPGKYLLDMRIVDRAGRVPGWRCATIRTGVLAWPFLLAFVSGPIGEAAFVFAFVWVVVLVVSIARDPGHRGIHDRMAGTRVVNGRMFPKASSALVDD
ncbi:MAG TPA: RDD family protein [Microthrixaceae bacterium]|nr:RDD family protein [Microthrixaceae bacterium]